jgi:hypothetical protein
LTQRAEAIKARVLQSPLKIVTLCKGEEEEEEDLFVFNDTIEGPRERVARGGGGGGGGGGFIRIQ